MQRSKNKYMKDFRLLLSLKNNQILFFIVEFIFIK